MQQATNQEKEFAQTYFQKILRRTESLPESAMRREAVGELLLELPSNIRVELLALICEESAKSSKVAHILQAIYEQPKANNRLNYEQIQQIYTLAEERNYPNVKRLFLSFSTPNAEEKKVRGHHQLSGLTLGERKFLARKHDIVMLEKLLLDPEPSVIRNILQNPRITEKEILFICTRRPNKPQILAMVADHLRWKTRYQVKLALSQNPYTPLAVIFSLLPTLKTPDLREIQRSHNMPPQVLANVDEILAVRGKDETVHHIELQE